MNQPQYTKEKRTYGWSGCQPEAVCLVLLLLFFVLPLRGLPIRIS
jgi:hypothetical protein